MQARVGECAGLDRVVVTCGAGRQACKHQKGSSEKGGVGGSAEICLAAGARSQTLNIESLPAFNPFSKIVSSSPTKIGQVMNDKKGTEEGKGMARCRTYFSFRRATSLL